MPFDVELEPSGRTFAAADDEPVLDAALRAGVLLPYGCRNGACGACKARVVAGETAYPGGDPRGLTERERAAGWVLLCRAEARSALRISARELDADKDLRTRTLPARVAAKEQLAHDVVGLYLELPRTERLQFLAGQYVDILMRDGRRRAFSLANAPEDDALLALHVRQIPGGAFSDGVLGELRPKSLLRLQGPLGSFFLRRESARPIVLVAGGTGFAPIKSIVDSALNEGVGRPMHVYWGARAGRDLYLRDHAEGWTREHGNVTFTPVLSDPAPEDGEGTRRGFVHEAVLADFQELSEHEVYASGPPAMVNAIREQFPARGLALEHLFYDSFEHAHETGHDA